MEKYVEQLAEAVHEAWMVTKKDQGVTSRRSESGEELMVPYARLSEPAKDLDRGSVRAVLKAAESSGLVMVQLGELIAAAQTAAEALEMANGTVAAASGT